MNVCVYTLGCRVNQCESEAIADAFVKAGFQVVGENDSFDLALVNTCTVTSKAEQKARRQIRLFQRSGAVVIATGCYAEVNAEALRRLGAGIVVFPLSKKAGLLKLPSFLSHALSSGISLSDAVKHFSSPDTDAFSFNPSSFSYHSRSYLKIQDGCDNECGYCRVHVARGKSQFLSSDEVIDRALALEKKGFQEIVLTGVNLTMYDHEGAGLGGLLSSLLPRLGETTRIRLSSLEPDHVDQRLIDVMSSEKMHPYFHIPVQSASDKVLTIVNRRYSVSHLSWVVDALREAKGDPFFGCDVITGLPGEGEAEAEETRAFLIEKDFSAFHVFPFSPRPDTPLFNYPIHVEERVRDERAEVLRHLSSAQSQKYLARQSEKECEVLIENRRRGFWYGTSGNYIKCRIENVPPFASEGTLFKARFTALTGAERLPSVSVL